MPNIPASKPSTCPKVQMLKIVSIRKGEPSVSVKVEIHNRAMNYGLYDIDRLNQNHIICFKVGISSTMMRSKNLV